MRRAVWLILAVMISITSYSQEAGYNDRSYLIQLDKDATGTGLNSLPSAIEAHLIFPDLNLWQVQFDEKSSRDAIHKQVYRLPDVQYMVKDVLAEWRQVPDDPDYPSQYGLGLIEMEEAWDLTTGGKAPNGDDIVVAIFDDGYQVDHSDYLDNVWVNVSEIPDNGVDDDLNGYVDDYYGWNATEGTDDHRILSHGTAVAGIIGAVGNNNNQVAGINWDVKLMLTSGGRSNNVSLSDIVKAYNYIYTQRKIYNETNGTNGAYVVVTNYSGGAPDLFPEDFPSWCEIYELLGQEGVLSVTSAPNTDTNVDVSGDLPSTCETEFLIVVTNTDQNDQKVSNAGFGAMSVDLGAPGEDIFTTGLNNNTDPNFTGASASAPHVAGVISLLYTLICDEPFALSVSNPPEIARTMRDAVFDGADFNESLTGITSTGGRLNALNALEIIDRTLGNCCVLEVVDISLSQESCIDARDASISIDVKAEELKGQLFFSIDGPVGNTADTVGFFERLDPMNYIITVFDEANDQCLIDTTVVLEEALEECPFGEFGIVDLVPNPTSNFLTIQYELDELKVVRFQIHDSAGRKSYDRQLTPELLGNRSHSVDISDYPQGIYFASIQANGIQHTQKFLVAR